MLADNRWENESDSDEELQNETPLKEVDPEFRNKLLSIKHGLYDEIVYSPDEESNESQDISLLQDYLTHLNHFYILSIDAQNGKQIGDDAITVFPSAIQPDMRYLLTWIREYFSNNGKEDTLPYSRMMIQVLHEDPFVQK